MCGRPTSGPDDPATALARHLVEEAAHSDVAHVMWLNRNVTKHRVDADELARLLTRRARGDAPTGERVQR